MNAMWVGCRAVAVTLLAAITVGFVFDLTAADLADAVAFLFMVTFVFTTVIATVLLAWVLIDMWRDPR